MVSVKNGEISGENPLTRGLNILLVDDDEICLFIHRRVLELSGLCSSTHSAGNGRSALDILGRAATGTLPFPDIIFLDLQMPVMDGIAFLEAFQLLDLEPYGKERIAIVLLTSSVSEKDKAYALSLGVKRYLTKPFTPEAFNSVVTSLFNGNEPLPGPFSPIAPLDSHPHLAPDQAGYARTPGPQTPVNGAARKPLSNRL